jgi:hypothetical protein
VVVRREVEDEDETEFVSGGEGPVGTWGAEELEDGLCGLGGGELELVVGVLGKVPVFRWPLRC